MLISVDGTYQNTLGRLVNDSPSRYANCIVKRYNVDGESKLILVASRDIEKDEELRYDYGDRPANLPWRKNVQYSYIAQN